MEKKDKDKLQHQIDVMNHFLNGGEVEWKSKHVSGSFWQNMFEANWNWVQCDYRKKKELIYVPFTYEDREQFKEKMVKVKGIFEEDSEFFIYGMDYKNIYIFYERKGIHIDVEYHTAFEIITFLDGSPFGKLEN